MIISLDGLDQETYSAYRINGRMDKVIEGLSNVVQAKRESGSSLKMEVQFLVNRLNEHQIPQIKQLAGDFGVSLRLKSMQIVNNSEIASWMPSEKKYRRYKIVEWPICYKKLVA